MVYFTAYQIKNDSLATLINAAAQRGEVNGDDPVWRGPDGSYAVGDWETVEVVDTVEPEMEYTSAGAVQDYLLPTVVLVIRGYEWMCPGCGWYNTTSGPDSNVTCEECGFTFDTVIADTW